MENSPHNEQAELIHEDNQEFEREHCSPEIVNSNDSFFLGNASGENNDENMDDDLDKNEKHPADSSLPEKLLLFFFTF